MRRLGFVVSVLVVFAVASSGCDKIKRKLGLDDCVRVHALEPMSEDVEALGRIVQLPARPLRVRWARGQVGGPPDGANLPGGGDWEVLALLEFAEPDANKLTDEGRGEVLELEVPAAAWMAQELGLPPPPTLVPGECRDLFMKVSGFGYDATPFVQYFLQPVALLKVPESSFFVLWLSTRPPLKEKDR